MSETARTGFLTGERKRKVKTMFFMDIIASNPQLDKFVGRLSLLPTAGTVWEQFGNRYASTVW